MILVDAWTDAFDAGPIIHGSEPMIKVFLSHQAADSVTAAQVARRLKVYHDIDSYLDVIDPYIGWRGEDLASHIRLEMGKCTQLLAVVSSSTLASQWVPWEIGVATEKDYPLATYTAGFGTPPEFLRKWPYLRSDADLDQYALVSKAARSSLLRKRAVLTEEAALSSSVGEFYSSLRGRLGQ
ncbi:toll/interleukin-1 receptor domain-containing protein [Sphingomonas sp. MMS24-J45]|uniref:toll/interleukin-1 receptor domain-containing protein n=1 Tax=Sphingomonas sp. MMS24-J45 TaxID=3238806 RepID=UPI00384D1FA8